MSNKHKHNNHADDIDNRVAADDAPVIDDIIEPEDTDYADIAQSEFQTVEKLQEQLDSANEELAKTKAELEKEKKEYLFLMADFDNYRKRAIREKADLIKSASEKALKDLLPIVDDFERGLEASAKATDAEAVRQGMELIYNKLIKYLAANGVTVMESTGADFDADLHEAIATIPAPSPDLKGKVIDTTQRGYMIHDKVLRHAKVAVGE